ncbi:hypothetical protein HH214_15715 [Mucilaginibacter robiniae]|uniref:Lipoprotein n=1 Tax=Mucilaginibacter robiniae TaxID=2728022 RepID=A0A7L5E1G9_9SPHI|nr:hypothetical protein [Mucilaginibacter robiniae]QJD97212.1 hypothetical protein HH214_15715 [Mucilaginibacter robiniae]
MKIQYFYIGLLLCLTGSVIASCQPQKKKNAQQISQAAAVKPAASNPEDQVVDLVMNLEEVKRKSAEVEKESKGKRHLSGYVETAPTIKDPNYWVKIAEDNGGSYVAYYTFAVDSKTHSIRYYDVVQDSLVSLSQWRQSTPADER